MPTCCLAIPGWWGHVSTGSEVLPGLPQAHPNENIAMHAHSNHMLGYVNFSNEGQIMTLLLTFLLTVYPCINHHDVHFKSYHFLSYHSMS